MCLFYSVQRWHQWATVKQVLELVTKSKLISSHGMYIYIKSCLCAGYNSSKQNIDVPQRLAKLEQHVKKTGTELKKNKQ